MDRRRTRLGVLALSAATLAGTALLSPAPAAAKTTTQSFLVVYATGASTSNASTAVKSAGGSVVANWARIGVVVARSGNGTFASKMRNNKNVVGVAPTASFATRIAQPEGPPSDAAEPTPAAGSGSEPLAPLQWDMRQINAFAAHEINGGSPDVVVGDVDTGLDFTHPDLAPNYRSDLSADCSSGVAQPLVAGNDVNGHGTHTAGTIAAAVNGIGISGVAPNVGIAGIKAANDSGFFFPEMVVCAYMWVATHDIAVTNNSYFADPWLFQCRDDAEQRAIWEAERRAIRYAQSRGTVVVASEGNEATDLSHPRIDPISPDFPPGSEQEREITNACAVVPVEIPGVVGVTATSNRSIKSFYSSYGISTADVTAPGGDSRFFDASADVPNGRVLSTYPAANACARKVVDQGATYCYLQGTSMASPHVAGVAALLVSKGLRGAQAASALTQAVTPLDCPDPSYGQTMANVGFTQTDGSLQECSGSLGHTSFYGSGEIDALRAVS